MNVIQVGFIKRAQENGLSQEQAVELLKQANLSDYAPEIFGGIGGALASGIPLGLLGMGVGALIPSQDEKGETHRLRNALLGGAAGLGVGGLAGGGLGAYGGHILRQYRVSPEQVQAMIRQM